MPLSEMTTLATTNRAWRSIRVNPKWIEARYCVGFLPGSGERLSAMNYHSARFETLEDVSNGTPVPRHEITWEDGSVTYE